MKIAVPTERREHERRVALTPDAVTRLTGQGIEVLVHAGAGAAASLPDAAYQDAGARIVADEAELLAQADALVTVGRPEDGWIDGLRNGAVLVGLFQPLSNRDLVDQLAGAGLTAFSLDAIPRITRSQSMDALSSQATVSGYKAVLIAAGHVPRFFPMLMTAAGTIPPAKVLVLGAGVAGLQAIATARRLGAVVSAFDTRPVVKEQVREPGRDLRRAGARGRGRPGRPRLRHRAVRGAARAGAGARPALGDRERRGDHHRADPGTAGA